MRPRRSLYPVFVICFLAGCHQPMVEPKPPRFRPTRSRFDWKNVAHDIASEMAAIETRAIELAARDRWCTGCSLETGVR